MFGLADKRFDLFLIILTAGVFLICGGIQSIYAKNAKNSNVVLRVNNKTLTQAEFQNKFNSRWKKMSRRFQKLPPRRKKMIKSRVKQSLKKQMTQRLALLSAVEKSQLQISESEIEQFYQEQFPTQKRKQQAMKRFGVDKAGLKKKVREMLLIQKFIQENIGEIQVSKEEMKNYYQKNKKKFQQPEKVKARHILINTKKRSETEAKNLAQKVKSELESGKDFCKEAKEYSDGPSGKKCGKLGYFSRQRMVPPFSQAAFNLSRGEYSNPVKTRFGYHIIEKLDQKSGSTTKFSDVKARINEQIKQQKKRKKAQKFITNLIEKSDVERNFPNPGSQFNSPRRRRPAQPKK